MPGAEQEFAPAQIQSFARTCRAGHYRFPRRSRRNAKSPDGPGAGHIATRTGYVSAHRIAYPTQPREHRPRRKAGDAPNAAEPAQSAVRRGHDADRRRATPGEALPSAVRPRTAGARHRSPVPPAHRRDRPAGAAEAARRGARYRRHRRGHRGSPPATAAAPATRALSGLHQRRDRRSHADLFQCAQGLLAETAAGRRAALRIGHGRTLRPYAADGASRPRRRGGGSREAAAGRTGLSADRGAEPQPGAQSRRCRAYALAGPAGMAGGKLGCTRALPVLHRPMEPADLLPEGLAWSRLAYDEFLAGQLALALVRAHLRRPAGRATPGTGHIRKSLIEALPYSLTPSQGRAVADIVADLGKPERMLRLLQGDVGSGKTVVALLAAAAAIEAGRQAALLAPTEILARQHFNTVAP